MRRATVIEARDQGEPEQVAASIGEALIFLQREARSAGLAGLVVSIGESIREASVATRCHTGRGR